MEYAEKICADVVMFLDANVLLYQIQHLLVFFYLYMQGETLEVKVNKLTSSKTQLPYDYYFLDYCTPPKIKNRAENLGEVLRGDRIESSVYSVCHLLVTQMFHVNKWFCLWLTVC